jgi:MT-A70
VCLVNLRPRRIETALSSGFAPPRHPQNPRELRNSGPVGPTFSIEELAESEDLQVATLPGAALEKAAVAAGTSLATAKRAKVVEKKAPKLAAEVKAGKRSIGSAHAKVKAAEKRVSFGDPAKLTELGVFDVVVADPPWQYDFSATETRSVEKEYPTMDVSAIKRLDVPSAADCVLYLWATAPKLREALAVVEAWGFTYKTNMLAAGVGSVPAEPLVGAEDRGRAKSASDDSAALAGPNAERC